LKSIIALTIAIALFITAGYFGTTTVNEQLSQSCAVGENKNTYSNSTQDAYFFWQWWPNRDAGQSFVDCVGPSSYLRYHPYDVAFLALLGAGVVGYFGLKDGSKRS